MKKYLFTTTFLLLPFLIFAQSAITGTITDKLKGTPLAGATIQTEGSYKVIVSDNNGQFTLPSLPPNTKLTVRYVGYKELHYLLTPDSPNPLILPMETTTVMADEIIISATRATDKSAMAISNISKSDLSKLNDGRDMPFLLESVPSLVPTSDAGTGIGYTGIRLRGSDATRINITVNGIPINDSESQQMYWVDLPDLASSVESIQVQRGAGTSTNGAGAFGGSVNIKTQNPSDSAFATISSAAGSFNTLKNTITFGTGTLNNHWNFDGRLSKITSDGFVDRATSNLKSFFVSGGYYGTKDLIKLNIFSGKEITYQSWYGVPEAALDTNRTWNYYTYENQVDDYQQDHYQLFYSREISKKIHLNTALHYTKGKGYYEEYKEGESFGDYNLAEPIIGNDTITSTNLVRRKWLDNDFYGATWSLNADPNENINLILGGAWNEYDGDHYGEIIWSQYSINHNNHYRYYDNNGIKTDFNLFLKTTINIHEKLSLFGDVQYRTVDYRFDGINDQLQQVPQTDNLHFFNPKAGITYTVKPGTYGYLSLSVGNKEPSRDDYTESTLSSRPSPERLYDFESGYYFSNNKFRAGFNYYLMLYDNQLVLTGQLNDVGNYTRTNIKNSFREGIEIEAGWSPLQLLTLNGNLTLGRSNITEFKQYIDNYDNGEQSVEIYRNTDIAFSPNITGFMSLALHPVRPLDLTFTSRYVGEQYLDNTSNANSTLDAWFTEDVRVTYVLKTKWIKEMVLMGSVNNLFNKKYESNGYDFSYISGGKKITENYYYPQAGTNFMAQLTLKF